MNKEQRKDYNLIKYHYRKDNRLCTYCGKPLKEDEIYGGCSECMEKCRKSSRESYAYYQRVGLCPICHKVKLKAGERRCPDCRKKRNTPRSDEYKARAAARERKKTAELLAKGICTNCGVAPATPGYSTCQECRDYKNAWRREYRARLKAAGKMVAK